MFDPLRPDLVPGRECGECTYCCQYLAIDTKDFQSQPGELCRHCKAGSGCTIYESRPHDCRTHFCGWRLFGLFDDSWRPDLCGILITPINAGTLPGYGAQGLELLLVDPPRALAHPGFFGFLQKAVRARIPLFLSLLGPNRLYSNRVFLNAELEAAIWQRDEESCLKIFTDMLENLASGPFQPVQFKHGNTDEFLAT
jgi:hypothetical protein